MKKRGWAVSSFFLLLIVTLSLYGCVQEGNQGAGGEDEYKIVGAETVYISVSAEEYDWLNGVRVEGVDGADIKVDAAGVTLGKPGVYTAVYTYQNATVLRKVYVLGDPKFEFEPQTLELGFKEAKDNSAFLRGVTAKDTSGETIDRVAISDYGTLDPQNPDYGEYTLVYSVKDRAGNVSSAERTVKIVRTEQDPQLEETLLPVTAKKVYSLPLILAEGDSVVSVQVGEYTADAENYSWKEGVLKIQLAAFDKIANGDYTLIVRTQYGYVQRNLTVDIRPAVIADNSDRTVFGYGIADAGGREDVVYTQKIANTSVATVSVNSMLFPVDDSQYKWLYIDLYNGSEGEEASLTVSIGGKEAYLSGNGAKLRMLNEQGEDVTREGCKVPVMQWMTLAIDLADYHAAMQEERFVKISSDNWVPLYFDNVKFVKDTSIIVDTDIILDTSVRSYDFASLASNPNGLSVTVDASSVVFGEKGVYWIKYKCETTKVTARVCIIDQIVTPDADKTTLDYTVETGDVGGRTLVIKTQIVAGNANNKLTVNPLRFSQGGIVYKKLRIDVYASDVSDFTVNIGGKEAYLSGNGAKLRMLNERGEDITQEGSLLPAGQWVTLVIDLADYYAADAEQKFVKLSTNNWNVLYFDRLTFTADETIVLRSNEQANLWGKDIVIDKKLQSFNFSSLASNVNGFPITVNADSVVFGTIGKYGVSFTCKGEKLDVSVYIIEKIVTPDAEYDSLKYEIWDYGGRKSVISTQIQAGNPLNRLTVNPDYVPAHLSAVNQLKIDVWADNPINIRCVSCGKTSYLEGKGAELRLLNSEGTDITDSVDPNIPSGQWLTLVLDLTEYKKTAESNRSVQFFTDNWEWLYFNNLRFE